MGLDPMFADAILGTFRNMSRELKDKEISGEDFDKMNSYLARMEELAQKHDDMNEFNGIVMQENLYGKFSDHYGRALSAASSAQYSVGGAVYDDAADQKLLKQTLDAYRNSIATIKQMKKENVEMHGETASKVFVKDDLLIKPIQDVISLGEAGHTYGTFLRLMIEKGLDKAMEGSIVSRDAIIYSRDFYAAGKINPHYEERENKLLEKWDELCAKSKIGVASVLKYNLASDIIYDTYEPKIKLWYNTNSTWDKALTLISEWAMAHMSFAPSLEPWSVAPNPRASVQETIDCEPGKLEVRLAQLKKYFGISFHDIFKHETFLWDCTHHQMWYSQEYIMYLRDEVFQHCKPGNKMPQELISKMEKIWNEKRMRNPDQNKLNERYRDNHNKYFGEGNFEEKYGMNPPYECNASSWDLSNF